VYYSVLPANSPISYLVEKISMFFIESDVLSPETDIQLLNRLREHKNSQLLDVPKVVLLVTSEADKRQIWTNIRCCNV
jgi:hypothetical protein